MADYRAAAQMQRHDLHKLHGLGNDFLVWFRSEIPEDCPQTARRWCDRRTGIGADGLIIAVDDRTHPRFVLFNADGGRPEISGNGLRCFGHAVARRRGVDELVIDAVTDAGRRKIEVIKAMSETAEATVQMGETRPGPSAEHVDLSGLVVAKRIDTIEIGNPHIVIEVDDPAKYDMAVVGPAIEEQFAPNGINVHLVAPTPDGLLMAIWERGAGATQACGSGACAAAAAIRRDRPDVRELVVQMPGGSATVEFSAAGEIALRGPSAYVAAIVLAGDAR